MKTITTILTIINSLTFLNLHADSYLKEDLIGDEKPIFQKTEEPFEKDIQNLFEILQSDLSSLEDKEEALRELICIGAITIKLNPGEYHE